MKKFLIKKFLSKAAVLRVTIEEGTRKKMIIIFPIAGCNDWLKPPPD